MAHPYHHAVRSARLFGGVPRDYLAIHEWFDESKAHIADIRHRALRHHSEGIFLCEAIFGTTLTNSIGKTIPVRTVGEQHVKDACFPMSFVMSQIKVLNAITFACIFYMRASNLKGCCQSPISIYPPNISIISPICYLVSAI